MNNKQPTLEQLSLYYDGLLDPEASQEIESYIASSGDARSILDEFNQFETAFASDKTEDQIGHLLEDIQQNIHQRLIETEHAARMNTYSIWGWLLSPGLVLTALAVILLSLGFLVNYEYESPEEAPDLLAAGNMDEPVEVNPAQKEAILAVARMAKSALSNGYDYAKQSAEPYRSSIAALPSQTHLGLAAGAVRSSTPGTEPPEPGSLSPLESTKDILVKAGAKQLALGVGVSLISLVTIF